MKEKSTDIDAINIDTMFEQFGLLSDESIKPVTAQIEPALDQTVVKAINKEQTLYGRLGTTVRQLHNAMRELGYERALDNTLKEITNSQDRLQYIATLTEQAANKVLNAVDEAIPIQTAQILQSKYFVSRWANIDDKFLMPEDRALLIDDSISYAKQIIENSEAEKARLMDIMMAQDFQDITGQIIKKIVDLTQRLEIELAQILKDYSTETLVTEKPVDLLAGPAIPDLAMAQDDVDSMLADLGF
jgi:chemotaxis protein CheZ